MKKIAIALVAVVGVMWWLSSDSEEVSTTRDGELSVFDRGWVSEMPKDPKQKVDVLVVLKKKGEFGVFQKTSAFEGEFTVFGYETAGAGKLKIQMLQSGKRAKMGYVVSSEGCGEFDYCLKVKGAPRGSKTYGSMQGWEVRDASTPEHAVELAKELVFAQ